MIWAFYIAAAVAVGATTMVITRDVPIRALLYLVVSLMGVAVMFYTLGAAFAAAMEAILYAGALVVLFVVAVVLLNEGPAAIRRERRWLRTAPLTGPCLLAAALVAEFVVLLGTGAGAGVGGRRVGAVEVGRSVYGGYLIGVILAGLLLTAGLVGAYHLGWREEGR